MKKSVIVVVGLLLGYLVWAGITAVVCKLGNWDFSWKIATIVWLCAWGTETLWNKLKKD